jgi:transcriptional regulator with PAS, ATPase and Fis domain
LIRQAEGDGEAPDPEADAAAATLADPLTGIPPEGNLKDLVEDYERGILRRALETYGNSYAAAKALGISQPTVVRKAHAYGIPLGSK